MAQPDKNNKGTPDNPDAPVLVAPAALQNAAAVRTLRTLYPALADNTVAGLFDGIVFKMAKTAKNYPNDDGSISRHIAGFVLPFANGAPACVNGKVYAKKEKGGSITVECTYVGGRGTQGFEAMTPRGEAELTVIKKWAAGQFAEWFKQQGIVAKPDQGVALEGIEF